MGLAGWAPSHIVIAVPKIEDEKTWHSHQEIWDQTLSFVPSTKTRWDWQDGLLLILWLLFPRLRMRRHDIPIRKYGTKRWALAHVVRVDGTVMLPKIASSDYRNLGYVTEFWVFLHFKFELTRLLSAKPLHQAGKTWRDAVSGAV